MILKILGTAAAEGWPADFCVCEACQKARELGGKDLRSRASLRLGESIQVDLPPDFYWHLIRYGLSGATLRHLLITHSHEDHFYPTELKYRSQGFCRLPAQPRLIVYGSRQVYEVGAEIFCQPEKYFLRFCEVRAFRPFRVDEAIEVIPVRAAHGPPDEEALNYILRSPGFTFLQAYDTGWYSQESWDAVLREHYDLVLMDCTAGPVDTRSGHLGVKAVAEAKQLMEKAGALKQGARFIATHFSHNGGTLHEQLEAVLGQHGIEVAYDGMEVVLPAAGA